MFPLESWLGHLAISALLVFSVAFPWSAAAQAKPRARDLGIPFDGAPGPSNAITDVAGVEVGCVTPISGQGPLRVGAGPVRTGVTAILPRGKSSSDPVFAGWFMVGADDHKLVAIPRDRLRAVLEKYTRLVEP